MPRIACLLVPDLPTAALCRAEPALIGFPLALTDGRGPHATVAAASPAARAHGIRPHRVTAAQAHAIAADLVIRPRDPALERSAVLALADVAATLASRVEVAAGGSVSLDTQGSRHLTGTSEAGLATALVARATRVGLEARAGIGSGLTVARLAARHATDGVLVVSPGAELGFLAPLPLACLAPDETLTTTLARWGVTRLGDLARLPAAEVAARLGPAGAALVRAARGEDDRPLAPEPLAERPEEATNLEYAIERLEPLLFVLRGLLERVLARLGLGGIGCARLELTLDLDGRERDVRSLGLAAPTRDAKTLLTCLRADLEAKPPRAAVRRVALAAVPERVRTLQLGLFSPPGPAPAELATTLARLATLCGPGRVGAPVVVDSYRPGVAGAGPFTPPEDVGPAADGASQTARLVVRALRPPRTIEMFCDRGRPDFVRGGGLGGRVVAVAGPWRLVAEWWSEAACARDYYDLELSDGGVYRCYREHRGGWFVDGIYD